MVRRSFAAFAAAALVSGCQGGSSAVPSGSSTPTPSASPTSSPTPSPSPSVNPSAQHLYVGAASNGSFQIVQYTLPLSPASKPNFGFPSAAVNQLAVDAAGNLMSDDTSRKLSYYTAPLSAAGVPAAVFSDGPAAQIGQIAFTPAGDLLVGAGSAIDLVARPFSSAGTLTPLVTSSAWTAGGTSMDAAGTLYVANGTFAASVFAYAPPYTGAPITTSSVALAYVSVALGPTQLFAAGDWIQSAGIDVYSLPLTASASPAFRILPNPAGGASHLAAVALDAAGNLYVCDDVRQTLSMYAPPFSALSAPVVTLHDPLLGGPRTIAIGT